MHVPERQYFETAHTYIIPGDPIDLAKNKLRTDKTWDAQKALRLYWDIELKRQHNDLPFLEGPLELQIDFFFDFPPGMPQKVKDRLLGTYHTYQPDLTRCIEFVEAVANDILYRDDCVIASLRSTKRYDTVARTEFKLVEMK